MSALKDEMAMEASPMLTLRAIVAAGLEVVNWKSVRLKSEARDRELQLPGS